MDILKVLEGKYGDTTDIINYVLSDEYLLLPDDMTIGEIKALKTLLEDDKKQFLLSWLSENMPALKNGIFDYLNKHEYTSISSLQRECSLGFVRAGNLLSKLQQYGYVAKESEGSKGFKVIK